VGKKHLGLPAASGARRQRPNTELREAETRPREEPLSRSPVIVVQQFANKQLKEEEGYSLQVQQFANFNCLCLQE